MSTNSFLKLYAVVVL